MTNTTESKPTLNSEIILDAANLASYVQNSVVYRHWDRMERSSKAHRLVSAAAEASDLAEALTYLANLDTSMEAAIQASKAFSAAVSTRVPEAVVRTTIARQRAFEDLSDEMRVVSKALGVRL